MNGIYETFALVKIVACESVSHCVKSKEATGDITQKILDYGGIDTMPTSMEELKEAPFCHVALSI